jgi:hypothetical protein
MAERLIAPVLKTGIGATQSGVQIPLSPPFKNCRFEIKKQKLEKTKNNK